jgi:transcriptional regulator with XRE-family HTH domain
MILNERIHMIRIKKNMSQAELAFKTGYSINEIINFETNGNIINGYTLLQLLNALDIRIEDLKKM